MNDAAREDAWEAVKSATNEELWEHYDLPECRAELQRREREETEWCHAANSVRFKCACGIIHNWGYEDLEGEDPITSMEALEYGIVLQKEMPEEDKRSEIHLRASFVAGDASQRKLWDDHGGCW